MYCNRHNHMSALISAGYSIISFIFVLFFSNFLQMDKCCWIKSTKKVLIYVKL